MLEIYFKSDKEVISFCEHLFCNNKHIELNWKIHEEWGNQLQFNGEMMNNDTRAAIVNSMVNILIGYRLSGLIKKIIKTFYYYTDPDEIERIFEITDWIFKGEDEDSLRIRGNKNPKELINDLFKANIKRKGSIHFESIVKFRLKSLEDQIIHYVGLAIDEFKREEDHQMFVNMLREYIEKKKARYNEIHVLQGEIFSFYRSDGKRFSEMELRIIMHKEPLYIVGLDAEEFNLAPLVALSPRKINIYGDYPSEPKTLTIINIFQEKVELKPTSYFPFPYSLNS